MSGERKRAKPANPERYLWQRGNRLWFRYAVPTRYRSVEAKTIIQRPLGTSDKREASVLAGKVRSDLHTHWDRLLGGRQAKEIGGPTAGPNLLELQLAATEAAYLRIQPKLSALRGARELQSAQRYEAELQNLRNVRGRFLRAKGADPLPLWEQVAAREIERRGWNLPKDTSDYRAFLEMISEAAIEVLTSEIAQREGRFGHQPSSPVVQAGLKAKAELASAGQEFMTLFERYAAQRQAEGRKRSDGINQDRKVVQSFADFIGADRSVRSITPAEVREWRDALAALPPSYAKAKAYAGLSMKEAASRAKCAGVRPLSPTTVNKYLSTVSPFLGWCVTNAYAERNPCDGLFYDIQKGKNPRPPFSTDQLRVIFSSALFTGFLRDGQEHTPGDQTADDWRYWIPLVCLFTGARIGEIAQLRVEDIQVEGGLPFILIRHDENTGQKTKSGQSRPAPVHSRLQTIGFLEFVERQRARADGDGNRQLFPELRLNDRGHIGAGPSRFWRDYLKRIGLKSGRDGIGAHSFRHTMADLLRQAGYLDDEIEVALGHNQKTVTAGYGRLRQGTVGRISRMLETVTFDGLFSAKGPDDPAG